MPKYNLSKTKISILKLVFQNTVHARGLHVPYGALQPRRLPFKCPIQRTSSLKG
jgi:hypothetical protein